MRAFFTARRFLRLFIISFSVGLIGATLAQEPADQSEDERNQQIDAAAAAAGIDPSQLEQLKRSAAGSSLQGPTRSVKEAVKSAAGSETSAFETPEDAARRLNQHAAPAGAPGELRRFGDNLFSGPPSTFAPATSMPVPVDYVIEPDDVVEVQLFGKKNAKYSLTVQRDGSLLFPSIGPVHVAGLTYQAMRDLVSQRVAQQFFGTESSVTMGPLRSVQVIVSGDATQPGSYTVSALSSMLNALFVSGGIAQSGSFRHIELRRRGAMVGNLDLYQLLLKGSTAGDLQVQNGDVIFVAPLGRTVAVTGAVLRPAIYELLGTQTVADLVAYAGGATPNALAKLTTVQRQNGDSKQVLQANYRAAGGNFAVMDGDRIDVPYAVNELRDQIVLAGAVLRDQLYGWHQGIRISDVVPDVNMLKPNPDLSYGLVIRKSPDRRSTSVLAFRPGAVFAAHGSPDDLPLQQRDTIVFFGSAPGRSEHLAGLLNELRLQVRDGGKPLFVHVEGAVADPGTYPYTPDMRLGDLLRAAQAPGQDALTSVALVVRKPDPQAETTVLAVRLDPASPDLNGFAVQPNDILLVLDAIGAVDLRKPLSEDLHAQARPDQLQVPHCVARAIKGLGVRNEVELNELNALGVRNPADLDQSVLSVPDFSRPSRQPPTSRPAQSGNPLAGGSQRSPGNGDGSGNAAAPGAGPGMAAAAGQPNAAAGEAGLKSELEEYSTAGPAQPQEGQRQNGQPASPGGNQPGSIAGYDSYYNDYDCVDDNTARNLIDSENSSRDAADRDEPGEDLSNGPRTSTKQHTDYSVDARLRRAVRLAQNVNQDSGKDLTENLKLGSGLNSEPVIGADNFEELVQVLRAQARPERPARVFSINGEVRFPGELPLAAGMTLQQAIDLAGGYTEQASGYSAEITHAGRDGGGQFKVQTQEVRLQDRAAAALVSLYSRDSVVVRRLPDFEDSRIITLSGEVKYPGQYRVAKGDHLSDVMVRAGGFTKLANVNGCVFTRESMRRIEEARLRELRAGLQQDLIRLLASELQQSAAPPVAGSATPPAVNTGEQLAMFKDLSQQLSKVKALGRVVIDMPSIMKGDPQADVLVQDGDALIVPPMSQEVLVIGEVLYPSAFHVLKSGDVKDYVNLSGGTTFHADGKRTYVIKANGRVLARASGMFGGDSVEAGDTIVVPLDTEPLSLLPLTTNLTQILGQLAITTAALHSVGGI